MEVVFNKVDKRFGKVRAVNQLDLKIHSGSLHFLLGPSGCGKTTTLRMLAGLDEVSAGQILFDGKDVTKLPAAERGVGMVFQNYALWPHMTVLKNIEYGLKLRKLSSTEMKKRIDDAISITQLQQFVDRHPNQLSGGQQQRVCIARALAHSPKLVLADEPTGNLDPLTAQASLTLLCQQCRLMGAALVMVTHSHQAAQQLDAHYELVQGRLHKLSEVELVQGRLHKLSESQQPVGER